MSNIDKALENLRIEVNDTSIQEWTSEICGRRLYHFKFFKGCFPQVLLSPFLNTLSQMTQGNSSSFIAPKVQQQRSIEAEKINMIEKT